jgi:hypothetical protein
VASTRSTGFDWKTFAAMWDGYSGKIDHLALMADLDGDWLEGRLRDESTGPGASCVILLTRVGVRPDV